MTERNALEIRQIPVKDFDGSALPAAARIPGTEAFETAVMPHLGRDDELIRIVAVPETGRTGDAVPPLRRCVKLDPACTQPTSQSGGEARA